MGHSIRERLANRARETGRPFQELLTYYAIERFLHRLGASHYADRFVLKGALMIRVWDAPHARPTRDADLLCHGDNSVVDLERVMREILETPVEPDGMRFDSPSVAGERIREAHDYQGVRIRFHGYLQQARIPMTVDVGFGDVIVPGPQFVDFPALLPNLPQARLRGYTRESLVAEKFEAMVVLGEINTRFKDFYDIWFLAQHFDFEATLLADALRATFERRATAMTATPAAWSSSFAGDPVRQAQWRAFLRRTEVTNAPATLADAVVAIRSFLAPLATMLIAGEHVAGAWRAPGPWQ
jgi:hypothetical protein